MTLQELMTELRENILHDRSDRTEESASDILWSDATLVRYINEAQRKLCREGLVIRDGTTAEVVQVTLVEGQSTYTLNECILAVISAKYDTNVRDLRRTGHWHVAGYDMPSDTDWFDINRITELTPGEPVAFATDEEIQAGDDTDTRQAPVLKVYPTPAAAQAGKIITLRVIRLPIDQLIVDNLKAIPEVPEEYHLSMLDWAAHLALRIVDHDAGDRVKSKDFEASFMAMVVKARNAAMRKMFTPMGWRFGSNGFVWTR